MKGETQSLHLQKMMKKHKVNPEYTLVLPSMAVKKKSLKKLERGDVLLLGLERLELSLMKDDLFCARMVVDSSAGSLKLEIISLDELDVNTSDSKKYEKLFCSFGKLQSRKLEVGHKIEISAKEMETVELFTGEKKLAIAALVSVDNEIAIEIKEVIHG